jgi:hypothetical protein
MTITPGADDEYEARGVHRPARNRVNPKIGNVLGEKDQ